MKLLIFVIIFVCVILCINKYSRCLNENFSDIPLDFDEMNEFSVLNVEKIGPLYIDGKTLAAPPVDPVEMNIYKDKPWEMKPHSSFTNIFNDEECNGSNYDDLNKFTPLVAYPMQCKPKHMKEKKVPQATVAINPLKIEFEKKLPKSGSFPPEIDVENTLYTFLGYAINQYYSQYYLIYENEVNEKIDNPMVNNDLKYLENKLYQYTLVKMKDNTPYVLHKVGPRTKININDVVYLSYGVFELGPLKIASINNYS